MKDWMLAGLVYVSAWVVGRMLVDQTGGDPFVIGWLVGCTAVILRCKVPWFRVQED